jgi:hypothetical protein
MTRTCTRPRWTKSVCFITAAAVALVLLLAAAPAFSAPASTSWTVSPTSKTITYGHGVTLNGTLTSGGAPVAGLWVDVAQATTQNGSYEVMYKVTAPAGPYATGTYSIAVMPLQTTYYRFQWPGDATYALGNSDVVPVQVKPSLGKPSTPSSVKSGKKFTVSGTIQPGEGVGPSVKITAYRKSSSGAYKSYKTYSAAVSGTGYQASITIGKTGKYKFKATTAASAQFAANETGFSSVLTVKQ